MKIWLAILAMTLVDSSGSLFYSKGMKQMGEISTLRPQKLLQIPLYAFQNPLLLIGFLLEIVNFFLFLSLLSWADLSLVIPMTAISYLFSLVGAKFWLKENVTAERWIGTVLVCAGVAIVSLQ